jgi:hypothetical protein
VKIDGNELEATGSYEQCSSNGLAAALGARTPSTPDRAHYNRNATFNLTVGGMTGVQTCNRNY